MCGIVGYAGNKSVESVLMVGLACLEYRGYDSAGIAVIDNDELEIRKEKGKIKALEALLKEKPVRGNVGVGHTRWATHGEPSQINAHPHTNEKQTIAVVHNGIIENYMQLKTKLQSLGYIFQSSTDTEVISHLLSMELSQKKSIKEAFLSLFKMIQGKWAIAVVFEKEPEKVYFAQDGAPLLIGKGKKEYYLASDLSALVRNSSEVCYLKPKQWGYFTKEDLELFDFDGNSVAPEMKKQEAKWEDVDKAGFPHYMLKEIYEQAGIFRKVIERRINENGDLDFSEMELSKEILSKVNRIVIQAAGTSLHSGMIGKHYLEQFTKIQTDTEMSSEFRYRNPVVEGDTLIIAISQSGETADTLASIHEAKAKFLKVLSMVNNVNSTIARESDAFIDTCAGMEIGVASTKAFTAQVLHLLLFAIYLSSIKWMMSDELRKELVEEIKQLPTKIEFILNKAPELEKWASDFINTKDFVFLGRTYNHPIALEGALKLKEISYIHASGYAGGEFKHGPIALITNEVPVVCIANKSEIYPKMISNIQEIKARNGKIISIVTEGDVEAKSLSDYCFEVPPCHEFLSPILNVIPLQLLSYYVAIARGCSPDQPRNLAKSVTVE
ncbi:MAG TPA: glutamine--fructose-6-phosphate transaminase (isomerizing) [Leptospiraceae bacterium]|nr:glutamine--fructose-6-phosphate transaminase (isomerizing) [Leptospiraceae bacterium]HMW06311.1 glutamine--fructose-6-phosphate transaminase (isomerizing) [Leptospiraceae bacterium]HMX31010.1 glutamine--fructose-6-phosphate transaminase (isomerizing) [Leptospiraceae bacterium]HMY32171.1 glutamine--fructose-6-phosphate transaminase (isomerizing) [Leptospiraceae bacterium]HMZ65100.1 glutamine--fructose-6-phosphate transaminase (isomerizing) [Leptospiraceae bacterium]